MSSVHSYLYLPSFIFFFTTRTFQQPHLLHIKERERERLMLVHRPTAGGNRGCQKDKAGGDRRSPCSTTTFAAPLPVEIEVTERTKPVEIGVHHVALPCPPPHCCSSSSPPSSWVRLAYSFFSFSFSCFSPPHTCPMSYLYSPLLLFSFSPSFKNIPMNPTLSLSLSLSLSLLDSRTFTSSLYDKKR